MVLGRGIRRGHWGPAGRLDDRLAPGPLYRLGARARARGRGKIVVTEAEGASASNRNGTACAATVPLHLQERETLKLLEASGAPGAQRQTCFVLSGPFLRTASRC